MLTNNNVKEYIKLVHLLCFIKLIKINYKKTNKYGITNHTKILLVQYLLTIWIKWHIIKIFKTRLELHSKQLKSLLNSLRLKKLSNKLEKLKNP